MKALSIRQPWATFIAVGDKTVECRSWKTDYRGDLLICSSATKQELNWARMSDNERACFPLGQAVCVVTLADVRPFQKSDLKGAMTDEMPDPSIYAWELENLRYIEPFPVKGKLNFFNVDDEKIHFTDVPLVIIGDDE
jgi:hypothetical protein